mmetsp:Transcript_27017/g.62622  ORF Transcript_27017/g.62622 Transcript_27017/m.62622 type:complete len:215 (+) Transcript_27017:451-1095(+)
MRVTGLSFSPDSDLCVGGNGEFGLWGEASSRSSNRKTGAVVNCCSWSTDGARVVLGMEDGRVSVREVGGRESYAWSVDGSVVSAAWNETKDGSGSARGGRAPNAWNVFLTTKDGVVRYFRLMHGGKSEEVTELGEKLEKKVLGATLLQATGHLVVAADGNTAHLHAYGDIVQMCELKSTIVSMVVHASVVANPLIAIGCDNGALHVYKLVGNAI